MSQPNWFRAPWQRLWAILRSLAKPIAQAIPPSFTAPARRTPAAATPSTASPFADVPPSHWARDYIQSLAQLGVISGFPDGRFRPEAPVTRAQFAAMLSQAFPAEVDLREVQPFGDVAPNYWANRAIRSSRASGFLSGYPGNRFGPEQPIPRVQVLVALVNGLNYGQNRFTTTGDGDLLNYYQDANQIPAYAIPSLAAATDLSLVVNYPSLRQLNPNRNASRAEIAALVYQALYQEGKAQPLADNPYRVIATTLPWKLQPMATLPVRASQLSFNGPGTRLATLNPAGELLQIWQSETGALLRSFHALEGTTFEAILLGEAGETAIALVQTLSSPSRPNPTFTLQAWQITTGQSLWQQPFELDRLENVAAATRSGGSPSLQLLSRPRRNEVLTQASFAFAPTDRPVTHQLRLHSLDSGEVTQTLPPLSSAEPPKLSFSATGDILAALATAPPPGAGQSRPEESPSGNSPQLSPSQGITLWQLSDGSRLPSIVPPEPNPAYLAIAFTPNGTLRAIAQSPDNIRLHSWDIRPGQQPNQPIDDMMPLRANEHPDRLACLSPDGVTYFAHGDEAGSRLGQTQLGWVTPLDGWADQAMFSDKGDWLAIASPNDVRIFAKTQPLSP